MPCGIWRKTSSPPTIPLVWVLGASHCSRAISPSAAVVFISGISWIAPISASLFYPTTSTKATATKPLALAWNMGLANFNYSAFAPLRSPIMWFLSGCWRSWASWLLALRLGRIGGRNCCCMSVPFLRQSSPRELEARSPHSASCQ